MTNKTNSFMFYENFLSAINMLPDNERGRACYEFCKYGITGELPEDASLKMFCIGVSASVRKYQGRGGKREGAGRKPNKNNSLIGNQNNQKNQNNQNNHKEQTETKTKTEIYKESFEKFWSIYPKQRAGSKEKAYKSFCKAINENRATEEQIIKSTELYANSDEVKMGYAKGCSAWLNDDRFNVQYNTTKQTFEW